MSATNMPSIQFKEDVLSMRFLNWDNQTVGIDFESVFTFRWMDFSGYGESVDDDIAYEIKHSEWIAELSAKIEHARPKVPHYHHYQFFFYDCWVFEVICGGFLYSVME
ncbi:MAG: hypothetical protein KDJ38_05155 [Gammaproteobacteria bacterium]|nr:hypothetical protein [Gammaproteobacteria bacterium]